MCPISGRRASRPYGATVWMDIWKPCAFWSAGKRRNKVQQSPQPDSKPCKGFYLLRLWGRVSKGRDYMWLICAIGSSVFAALTSILAKVGIEGVNSTLATAVRTTVVVLMSWGMVFLTRTQNGLNTINRQSWLFLILSGLATGASWLCYYKALQLGEVRKVVPVDKLSVVLTLILAFVFLKEPLSLRAFLGCVLITAGTLLLAF